MEPRVLPSMGVIDLGMRRGTTKSHLLLHKPPACELLILKHSSTNNSTSTSTNGYRPSSNLVFQSKIQFRTTQVQDHIQYELLLSPNTPNTFETLFPGNFWFSHITLLTGYRTTLSIHHNRSSRSRTFLSLATRIGRGRQCFKTLGCGNPATPQKYAILPIQQRYWGGEIEKALLRCQTVQAPVEALLTQRKRTRRTKKKQLVCLPLN